jgi:hypothetical protein
VLVSKQAEPTNNHFPQLFCPPPQQLKLHYNNAQQKHKCAAGKITCACTNSCLHNGYVVNIPQVNNIMWLYEVQASVGLVSTFEYAYQSSLDTIYFIKLSYQLLILILLWSQVQNWYKADVCYLMSQYQADFRYWYKADIASGHTKPGKDPYYQCWELRPGSCFYYPTNTGII